MSDGGDVGELTRDLIALGYGDGLARGNHYSQATAAAVERWQQALGLPVTGEILLGEVVFEPGPIRVTSVTASAGAAVGGAGGGGGSSGGGGGGGGGGTVLTATGTTPVVTVALDVTQEYRNSSPTVTVTITMDSTPPGAALDQAPVNVNIITQTARNVLAVPVNALLALAGGGFGVQVVTGRTTRLAGVTTGLYSDTMVQVSGPGIAAGMRVEVRRRDPDGPFPGLAGRGPGAGA
jgi:peptidoglycan hydrolase-like protein with peptidoglycan-binding domain